MKAGSNVFNLTLVLEISDCHPSLSRLLITSNDQDYLLEIIDVSLFDVFSFPVTSTDTLPWCEVRTISHRSTFGNNIFLLHVVNTQHDSAAAMGNRENLARLETVRLH